MAEDTHEVEFETYEESWTGRIVIAVVVALALIAGAFFAGKAMAGDSGPATLADAVTAAQKGDLPCGDTGNAAATPAGTPDPNGGPPAGGGGFFLRGICNQDGGGQAGNAQGGRFGGRGGFGGQTVTAVGADSITVEGPNGSTTVKLDANTTVNKSTAAGVSDIKKGDSVMVLGGFGPGGQQAQDGAARSITILPQTAGN